MELAVGFKRGLALDPEGGVWILSVDLEDLQVQASTLIAPGREGLPGTVQRGDAFGASLSALPRGKERHRFDLAIGAPGDSAGRGAVWLFRRE